MDVHDCCSVSKSQPLCPANIITIEPGIYIPLTDNRDAAEYVLNAKVLVLDIPVYSNNLAAKSVLVTLI